MSGRLLLISPASGRSQFHRILEAESKMLEHRGSMGLFAVILLLGALQVGGCQDVREAAELRRAAVDRFGWTRVEIGVFPGEDRVEVTVSEPDSGASAPDESTARAMARLARDHYSRARRADSIEVAFVVSEGSDADAVRVTRSRRYTFAADSI